MSFEVNRQYNLKFKLTNDLFYSINRNNGVLLAASDAGPNITANNVIYHSNKYPSHVTLPVVNKKLQLPKYHNIKEEVEKSFPNLNVDQLLKG